MCDYDVCEHDVCVCDYDVCVCDVCAYDVCVYSRRATNDVVMRRQGAIYNPRLGA